MPIKGLTTREDLTARFPRIGKLRKGGEKTAKGYGPDLDHFRFTSDRPEIVAAFADVYGDNPHALPVYLPHATVEDNFPTWKESWTAGGLQHRCDGETCTIWLGPDGKYHRTPKPCPGGCDEVGRLELIIPDLIAAGFVGTVTLETHSLNDMIAITETLLKTAEMREGDPRGLRGVLFTLRRVPEKISVPGWGDNKGKRQRVEKWLVKIEPAVDWVQAQMALTRAESYTLTSEPQAALPAPVLEGEFEDSEPQATKQTHTQRPAAPAPKPAPVHAAQPDGALPTAWLPFAAKAVADLGYNHAGHVANTLKGDGFGPWPGDKCPAPVGELWTILEAHQAAKSEDADASVLDKAFASASEIPFDNGNDF